MAKNADAFSAKGNALTLACALKVEERAARKGGARTALVGLGAGLPLPEGQLVSFGLIGEMIAKNSLSNSNYSNREILE